MKQGLIPLPPRVKHFIAELLFLAGVLLLSGCSYFVSSATEGLARNISTAILNQDDPKTVKEGAPAYLLMIDGLIEGDPNNQKLLLAGARLYGSYASVFVDDPKRAQRLSDKARKFGIRALCRARPIGCGMHERPYDEYVALLPSMTLSDVSALYTYAVTWAGWIQTHQDDFNAMADIPKVKAAMQRVLELEETHDRGGAHLYLGVLSILLPPTLGGKPDEARAHFERAIELSGGRNLMAKVVYAERYARMVFDRALHDELLRGVLAEEPREPGFTLMNILAQEKARKLLASGDQYF